MPTGSSIPGSGRRWTWPLALVALVVLTFAIRACYYGNPLIDVDEEFYLLAGDRLLHGVMPYVDLWDRKPVGLFLLYAAIRLLGGDGILQYQLVASGFAAAGAVTVACLARRVARAGAAWVVGLLYVAVLAMLGGQGGQTPVFYNPLIALAAGLVLTLVAPADGAAPRSEAIRRRGAGAMLLVGLALQVKYSAVFEGAFLGVALLWVAWRAAPRPGARLIDAALWIALAFAPTLLAWGWYAYRDAGDAFVYANFTSILARGSVSWSHQRHDLVRIVLRLLIFLVPILIGQWVLRPFSRPPVDRPEQAAAWRFLVAWALAALLGFVAFGTFFNHYALPLLPPLAILAAPTFAIRWRDMGRWWAAIALVAAAIVYPLEAEKAFRRRGDAAWARAETAAIAPRLRGGCLWVFYGDPIYYQLTRSCLPTRFAFPFHLSLRREAAALGVDPLAETRRILATKPDVVLDRLTGDDEVNVPVQALVRAALHRHYRLVWSRKHPDGADADIDQVWARLPGR